MNSLLRKYTNLQWACGLSLFLTMNVYYKWIYSGLDLFSYFYLIVVFNQLANKQVAISLSKVVLCLGFIILFIWTRLYSNPNLLFLLMSMSVPLLMLIPIKERSNILDCYILYIFPLLLGLSIITYLLWSFDILNLPGTVIPALNSLKTYDYVSHVFFVIPTNVFELGRFHSFYDEPGVVGTMCAIILYYYNRRLTIWQFLIYFIAGVLSFSFFFFIVILIVFLTYRSEKLTKKISLFVLAIVIMVGLFSFFQDDFIYHSVISRFENIQQADYNRNHEEFRNYFYNSFIYSNEFYFGTNDRSTNSLAAGSYSILVFIYRYGLIYVMYALMLYVFLFWAYKKSIFDFLGNIVVWGIFIYQRPSFVELFYFIFFATILEAEYDTWRKESINKKLAYECHK